MASVWSPFYAEVLLTCISRSLFQRNNTYFQNICIALLTRAPLSRHSRFSTTYWGEGGGGVFELSPSTSAPIGHREKRKKAFESSSKMITKVFRSIFRLCQNCDPMAKKLRIFRVFSRLSNIVSENLHYLGN